MSIFYASFQKSRSGMLTNVCEIEKTVELTDEEYALFSQNLTVPHEMLARESERFRTDKHGIARCLLVMAEGRQDGTPISRLSADMLTEEGKREWADVLSAKVESITFENESFKCKLANCDPERLRAFTEMLNGQCDAEDYERWVKSSGITYPQTEDHSPTLSM